MFKVTNTNTDGIAKDFVGRFNGIDYLFPSPIGSKMQPVYIDDEAATHIFGIGTMDKQRVLVRHGWATFTSGLEGGMKILNRFVFEQPAIAYDAPMAMIGEDHGPAPVVQDAPDGSADDDLSGVVAGSNTLAGKNPDLTPPPAEHRNENRHEQRNRRPA